jgi:transposase
MVRRHDEIFQFNKNGGLYQRGREHSLELKYLVFSQLREACRARQRGAECESMSSIGRRLGVGKKFVCKLFRDHVQGRSLEALGSLDPSTLKGKRRGGVRETTVKMTGRAQEALRALSAESPEKMLDELQADLEESEGVRVSVSLVCQYLKRMGITRKRVSSRALVRQTERQIGLRAEFVEWQRAATTKGRRIFFQDESGVNSGIGANRRYGYARRGEPAVVHQPGKSSSKRHNVLATVGRGDGSQDFLGFRVVHGKVNREVFLEHLRDDVLPHLRAGDALVLDNYSIHKGKQVRDLVESKGVELRFLPPYSPEFNPIECVFGNMKGWLRRNCYYTRSKRGQPITVGDVEDALQQGMVHLGAWCIKCGYGKGVGRVSVN